MPKKFYKDINRAENYDEEGKKIFRDLVDIYQSEYMKKAGSSKEKLQQVKEDLVV